MTKKRFLNFNLLCAHMNLKLKNQIKKIPEKTEIGHAENENLFSCTNQFKGELMQLNMTPF